MTEPDVDQRVRAVRWSREQVLLPTYSAPPADPHPMFLDKRVYQGSSGKVYPYPFTDRVTDEKSDVSYDAVFLENEFIRLMILPSLGGRIHMAVDKTNGYNIFYHNRVIKPALVGLLGPWISGGVEFNWPQHHRPTTFMALDCAIVDDDDGSTTVWLGEVERMQGLKGMHGITLRPGSSAIEVHVRTYNPTPLPQTFLWWANVAVHVNDRYESFFPPDVTYVADHARRAVSSFPIARGTYYGVDYSSGVALNWYKNIPVPTSYMVLHSDYDFFGGYDHGRAAGFVHVADHHVVPGKKQWTWGNSAFGYAWDRNLTDEDGPYVELMAGAYTDNQPDFSWLQPYETKTFHQSWYPIREIGPATNANELLAVRLDVQGEQAIVGVHASQRLRGCAVRLMADSTAVLRAEVDLAPDRPFVAHPELAGGNASATLTLLVAQGGRELIRYVRDSTARNTALPAPARPMPLPSEISTTEELYLAGLHLEQYRHATRSPEPYYREGLARAPGDVRCNNALGMLLLRRGEFEAAAAYFRSAAAQLTRHNANPYDGEPLYNLGVACGFLGSWDEAYDAYNKAAWNQAWAAAGLYAAAQVDCRRADWQRALAHLDGSIGSMPNNNNAHNLKACVLRRLGRQAEAAAVASLVRQRDVLDHWCRNELYLLHRSRKMQAEDAAGEALAELTEVMRGEEHAYLDLALAYAGSGLYEDAQQVLEGWVALATTADRAVGPQVHYFLALFADHRHQGAAVVAHLEAAAGAPSDYCFPNRLEAIAALELGVRRNSRDSCAPYYLGNLLYDKGRHAAAVDSWELSRARDASFATVHRNLALAYFNGRRDATAARAAMTEAVDRAPGDARLLYELDQLLKITATPPAERLSRLRQRRDLVDQRDDLYLEFAALHNLIGRPDAALNLLKERRFHPWEGGEGRVPEQWVLSHLLLGRGHLAAGKSQEALQLFVAATTYPRSLGEGKPFLGEEAAVLYAIGTAHAAGGDENQALSSFQRAAAESGTWSEQTYDRGLALSRLGRVNEARVTFEGLAAHGATLVGLDRTEDTIDYFATSLPSLLIFEDDLHLRRRVTGHLLLGLGHLGLGDRDSAGADLSQASSLDPNNLHVVAALRRLEEVRSLTD